MTRTNPLHSSLSKEHYTPSEIVESARAVMAGIDLDPASCAVANGVVKASRYYSANDDALSLYWDFNGFPSKVFLNPPGGKTRNRSIQAIWWDKLLFEYQAGRVQQAIFVGFSLEILAKRSNVLSYPCCIINSDSAADCVSGSGRIKFLKQSNGQLIEGGSPTHGNVIVHLPNWDSAERFEAFFSCFGRIVTATDAGAQTSQFSIQEVS